MSTEEDDGLDHLPPDPTIISPDLTAHDVAHYIIVFGVRLLWSVLIIFGVFLVNWLLSKLEEAFTYTATSRAEDEAEVAASATSAATTTGGERKKRKRWHGTGRCFTLGLTSYARNIILTLRLLIICAATVGIVLIFYRTLPTWISFSTVLFIVGLGLAPVVTQYLSGWYNTVQCTHLMGRLVKMVSFNPVTGTLIKITTDCVVLRDPQTQALHCVPHTVFLSTTRTILDGDSLSVGSFSV
jgi:hypothetical protein